MTTGPKTTHWKRPRTGLPILNDPHLVALLLYVSGTSPDDDESETAANLAATLADSRELLTSQPLTSAFASERDRPSIDAQVRVAVAPYGRAVPLQRQPLAE